MSCSDWLEHEFYSQSLSSVNAKLRSIHHWVIHYHWVFQLNVTDISMYVTNISLTWGTVFKASAQSRAPFTHLWYHHLNRLVHDNSCVSALLHWLGHYWLRVPCLSRGVPWLGWGVPWLSSGVPWLGWVHRLHAVGRGSSRSGISYHFGIFHARFFRHVLRMTDYKI